MKQKFQLTNPNNARIFIDYRKKKDKVRFEYVGKRNLMSIIYPLFISLWIMKFLWLVGIGILLGVYSLLISYPNLAMVWIFFYFGGIPFIATLIFASNKNLIRLLPHLWYWSSRSKYAANFTYKDVERKKITIPMFSNVGLDYKATKEMARYLERVEVIEHPFIKYVRRLNGKPIKKPQEFLWRADFYFSRKPKTGELKVIFS